MEDAACETFDGDGLQSETERAVNDARRPASCCCRIRFYVSVWNARDHSCAGRVKHQTPGDGFLRLGNDGTEFSFGSCSGRDLDHDRMLRRRRPNPPCARALHFEGKPV